MKSVFKMWPAAGLAVALVMLASLPAGAQQQPITLPKASPAAIAAAKENQKFNHVIAM